MLRKSNSQTVQYKTFNLHFLNINSDLESLSAVCSESELRKTCEQFTKKLGMDYFAYGIQYSTDFNRSKFKILNNYSDDWNEKYYAQGYINTDPIVKHCYAKISPLIWDTTREANVSKKTAASKMMAAAYKYNIAKGLSVPIHDGQGCNAIFTLACNCQSDINDKHLQQIAPYASLFAASVHEKMSELVGINVKRKKFLLTNREKECLSWTADGKTAWEIANILKITERTANFHLHNAMHKLEAVNKPHAVAKAIAWGIIRPPL